MQHCDSTCQWCARQFFRWWKDRVAKQERQTGRSGNGSFNAAAATSVRPPRVTIDRTTGIATPRTREEWAELLDGTGIPPPNVERW